MSHAFFGCCGFEARLLVFIYDIKNALMLPQFSRQMIPFMFTAHASIFIVRQCVGYIRASLSIRWLLKVRLKHKFLPHVHMSMFARNTVTMSDIKKVSIINKIKFDFEWHMKIEDSRVGFSSFCFQSNLRCKHGIINT